MKDIKYGDIEYFELISFRDKISWRGYDKFDLINLERLRIEVIEKIRVIEEKYKQTYQNQPQLCSLGECKEKNCKNEAVVDYNGQGHYVCKSCDESLTRYFEEEYK